MLSYSRGTPGPWFDYAPVLGVEFKPVDAAAEHRDDVAAIRQAVDYSYCEFDGYGRLGVFLCPSPVLHYLRSANDVPPATRPWPPRKARSSITGNDSSDMASGGAH